MKGRIGGAFSTTAYPFKAAVTVRRGVEATALRRCALAFKCCGAIKIFEIGLKRSQEVTKKSEGNDEWKWKL